MQQKHPKEMLKFRASPLLRRAIKLKAALDDVDLQDVIIGTLEKGLALEIKEVQERGLVDDSPSQPKRKRGRKRKPDDAG